MTSPLHSRPFSLGTRVVDRDADPDDRDAAVVVALPEPPADEYAIPAIGEAVTVADVNPDYPDDTRVVEVAFPSALADAAPEWERAVERLGGDPHRLERYFENVTGEAGVMTYSYPAPRLKRANVATGDGVGGERP